MLSLIWKPCVRLLPFLPLLGSMIGGGCGPERRRIATPKSDHNEQQVVKHLHPQAAFDEYFQYQARWLAGPKVGIAAGNRIEFSFTDKADLPLPVEGLAMKMWMKVHNHGGRDFRQKITPQHGQDGRPLGHSYVVEQFYFTMAGSWELNLQVKIAGQWYAIEHPVEVEG